MLRSRRRTPLPRPGQVVLPRELARTWSIVDGGTVTLAAAGGGHSVRLRATVASEVDTARLTGADLGPLAPHAAVSQLWLRLSDPSSPSDLGNVSDVLSAAAPTAQVSGVAAERTAINRVLDVLLLVVTALLAVAVLIALIGVGNTLALSVVERRQETGLLRALGLTRRQLRRLLAWEAGLVAGVASLLGVLLGGTYGLAGAAAVLGGRTGVVLSVPWLQVLAIVVVATTAGLLASVLPARRAARTSPVSALAS